MLIVKTFSETLKVSTFENTTTSVKLVSITMEDKIPVAGGHVTVPGSGAIMAEISKYFFRETDEVCPNFYTLLDKSDEDLPQNTLMGLYAEPIPLRFVVQLPTSFEILSGGGGDGELPGEYVTKMGVITKAEFKKIRSYSTELFVAVKQISERNGILTPIELSFKFGRLNGGKEIVLIGGLSPRTGDWRIAASGERLPNLLWSQLDAAKSEEELAGELREACLRHHLELTGEAFTLRGESTKIDGMRILDFALNY
ncbi:MAG: hypothetical protein LBE03_01920 [Candidatus Nomurabacteria bacterium]|jgi:hypothetical protein|nr:hypothetical protein [Candidatus Nomurabacteria bacterium]